MTNSLYPIGKNGFLDGSFTWTSSSIVALLVRTAAGAGAGGNPVYTYSATHQFLSSVPNNAYCRVMASSGLTSMTAANGAAYTAHTFTYSSVPSGDAIQALILYVDIGGLDTTRRLLAYYDTGTAMPITPNGANIVVQWPLDSSTGNFWTFIL